MSHPADSLSQAYLKALMVPAMAMAQAALSRVIYRTILGSTPIAHDAGCPVPVTLINLAICQTPRVRAKT